MCQKQCGIPLVVLCFTLWSRKLPPPLSQSEGERKPIPTSSFMFFPAHQAVCWVSLSILIGCLRYSINNAFDWFDLFPSWTLIGFYHLAGPSFSICNVTVLTLCVTWLDWLVPKLSSSLPSVDILPVTPDILYNRSPSSWTELCRILQLSSNNPFSSSGKNSSMAVLAYKFTIRWPAFRDVSRTYSDSSARPLIEDEKYVKFPVSSS